jgi:hypothetical protein
LAEYTPVSLNLTAGTFSEASIGVNLVNASYPGATGSYLNRYWNITSTGITDMICDAQFDYVPADVTGIESELYCYRVAPDVGEYNPADITIHQLTADGVTYFGTFTGTDENFLALPIIFTVTGSGSYCDGEEGLPVGLSGSQEDVVYTLFKDGVAQASTINGTGNAISFGYQLAGTYTVDGSNINGTSQMSGSAIIIKNSIPLVSWISFEPDTLCEGWDPVLLTGGIPEGGIYSGDGVVENYFDPQSAGFGEHLLTYSYTDENGCSATSSLILFVDICENVRHLKNTVSVYPNPVREILNILPGSNRIIESVALFDELGLLVFQNNGINKSGLFSISVQNFRAGKYWLRITCRNEILTKAFIIQ